jgi:hypothetical protein
MSGRGNLFIKKKLELETLDFILKIPKFLRTLQA